MREKLFFPNLGVRSPRLPCLCSAKFERTRLGCSRGYQLFLLLLWSWLIGNCTGAALDRLSKLRVPLRAGTRGVRDDV